MGLLASVVLLVALLAGVVFYRKAWNRGSWR